MNTEVCGRLTQEKGMEVCGRLTQEREMEVCGRLTQEREMEVCGRLTQERKMDPIPVLPVPHQMTPSVVSTNENPTTAPITAWVVEIGIPNFVAIPTQVAAPMLADNIPRAYLLYRRCQAVRKWVQRQKRHAQCEPPKVQSGFL
jgi:hypothetical protein